MVLLTKSYNLGPESVKNLNKVYMKKLFTLITVAATAITMQAQNVVDVSTYNNWVGYMNVFETPANGGGFAFGSSWGLFDVKSEIDSVNQTVRLFPNFNTYDSTDAYWVNTTTYESNKQMEASTFVESDSIFNGQDLTFQGTVTGLSLIHI